MADLDDVLVVEDNPQNLELVTYLLEEAGIRVRSAGDAGTTHLVLAAGLPDAVLMDMQLPGTDGLGLVARLRADPRTAHLPIIALTAHAMRGDRERFLAGGCDGYLAKPIDTATFVDDVRRLVAEVRRRR